MTLHIPVFHHDRIDSTNLEAQRMVASGLRTDVWIRSDEQTHGRGRSDHKWISPVGNLYATRVLWPNCGVRDLLQLSFVAGLAIHDTISKWVGGSRVMLKWPNDCLVQGAKISGILVESLTTDKVCVAIGCGINVEDAPSGLTYATARLRDHNGAINTGDVFGTLDQSMSTRLQQWNNGSGFAIICAEWLARAHPVGARLTVNLEERAVEGIFRGLAEDGAMLFENMNGRIQPVYSGDVGLAEAVQ